MDLANDGRQPENATASVTYNIHYPPQGILRIRRRLREDLGLASVDDDEVMLNILRCQLTNAEAWFNIALRPRKPEGSLGRTAQDGHLDSHTAPGLCEGFGCSDILLYASELICLLQESFTWGLSPLCHSRSLD